MSIDHVKEMAAAGYVAGGLTLAARADTDGSMGVLPVVDTDGNYTGEVRFLFAGEWYAVTPRLSYPPGDPCPTCSGRVRETVDMRCPNCGKDFMAVENGGPGR